MVSPSHHQHEAVFSLVDQAPHEVALYAPKVRGFGPALLLRAPTQTSTRPKTWRRRSDIVVNTGAIQILSRIGRVMK